MIVLDASAALALLSGSPPGAAGELRDRLSRERESIHVPHPFDLEVLSAIRRWARAAAIELEDAATLLSRLNDLRVTRYPHVPFRERIWELRDNLTVYDAAYVVLAEALDAPLVTADAALAGVPGTNARVELLG